MAVRHITGKQVTFTYGTLDASAQITSVSVARASSSETIHTLGAAVTTAGEKEITIGVEMLFDPQTDGISALLHAAWVAGDTVGVVVDYGDASSTYDAVTVVSLDEAVPADGVVTQTASLASANPDAWTWAAVAP